MPARKIVRSGLYSSHSPGRSGFPDGGAVSSYATPMSLMPRACSSAGAEEYAMVMETANSAAAIVMLCHNPRVWLRGIRPLILRIAGGSDAGAAIMRAADEV